MNHKLEEMTLTERQIREKKYYEQYSKSFDVNSDVDFSPVLSNEKRPWNSYWAVYQMAKEKFVPGMRLLDFGSGPGDNALRFSKIGYDIEGFDISEGNIAIAQLLFSKYKSRGRFQVSSAEELSYDDNSFDMIAGIDILHHIDILASMKECLRVLKPGGVAIFREPIEVDFIDTIRNTSLVKMIAPKDKSFEHHITEDEKKLTNADLEIIKTVFPNAEFKRFFFLARLDRFYRKGSDPSASLLEKLDAFLFKLFPSLKNLGGVVVIVLKK